MSGHEFHPSRHPYITRSLYAGKECDAVAEYYADCFGELETESDSSSVQGENADESTGVSGRADRSKVKVQGGHSHTSK